MHTGVVAAPRTVLAAGAVVWRPAGDEIEVLVVHRPRHLDWTLPKGKVDPGEQLPVTAVREVLEETSVPIRLGVPLARIEYDVQSPRPMTKRVSYWEGRPLGTGDIGRDADDEIDGVRWVRVAEVMELLTYERDRDLVRELLDLWEARAHRTRPLIVLRHAQALARSAWDGDDAARPLAEGGLREAHRLVPLLTAYGVARVVSSDATRCVQTVEPLAEHLGVKVERDAGLSDRYADPRDLTALLRRLAAEKQPVVVCTHRPVLPLVLAALEVDATSLDPAAMVVAHCRRGRVVRSEMHAF